MTPAATPSLRELRDRLVVAEDTKKVIAALRIATNALAWYADEEHWREDDWNVRAVITGEYDDAGKKARNAIKRIERTLR